MKKIINGKKYDTKTANYIATREWMDSTVNQWMQEDLYCKKTGEYFRFDDKSTTWGNINRYTSIVPLTLEEAKKWVEKHINSRYEELFGQVEE